MIYAIVSVVSYLLGSIPFGIVASRIAGVDVREHGSGNIGATNVLRVLGKKYGYPVFLGDVLKGFVAVRFALALASRSGADSSLIGILAAICAIVGHSFPVWLGFKGGKGVATSAGAGLGLVPLAILLVALVWGICFFLSRIVSLASVVAAGALPLAVWFIYHSGSLTIFALIIAALVVARHHANIVRIIQGSEPRFRREK